MCGSDWASPEYAMCYQSSPSGQYWRQRKPAAVKDAKRKLLGYMQNGECEKYSCAKCRGLLGDILSWL
jgi:hypothetical protein